MFEIVDDLKVENLDFYQCGMEVDNALLVLSPVYLLCKATGPVSLSL